MNAMTIGRTKAGYNQITISDAQIASATSLRRIIFEERRLEGIKPYVPESTYDVLRREWEDRRAPIGWNHYAKLLLHRIVTHTADELSDYYEVTEGLEHRIKRVLPDISFVPAADGFMIDQLLAALKTKRYTRTKLQRTLLRIMLGHRKEQLTPDKLRLGPGYLRVLGFTAKGRELLRRMKSSAAVPVISKVKDSSIPFLQMDIQATAAYALGYENPQPRELYRDYYMAPLQI
jgi:predicted nucleotidyltransferase